MNEKYQKEFTILKDKLEEIDFKLENENENSAIFGNNTNWKIIFSGEKYEKVFDIEVKNIKYQSLESFSIYYILELLEQNILYQNVPLHKIINLLIKHKDIIFDETFPYKEKYDELNNIPDWLLLEEQK